jgi:FlaA1/EpsC-like NDP-sugar epimerase
MTEMLNAIRGGIAHAAESQGPAVVVAMAEARVAEARREAITSAEKQGVQVRIMPTVVHIDDGREKWPSALAEILCEQPELASTPNDELMRLVSERLGLNWVFRPNVTAHSGLS